MEIPLFCKLGVLFGLAFRPPDAAHNYYIQALEDAEMKRIDELGNRLRTQRMEADERKKEKEVKYTDRLPDQKRTRTSACKGEIMPNLIQFRETHDA